MKKTGIVLALMFAMLAPGMVKADTINSAMQGVLQFTSGALTGHYVYLYNFFLLGSDKLTAVTPASGSVCGNSGTAPCWDEYITLYDFVGFDAMGVDAAAAPDWTASSAGSGPVPFNVIITENPFIPDLTWFYTGAGDIASPSAGLDLGAHYGCTTPDAIIGGGTFLGDSVIAPFGTAPNGSTNPCWWAISKYPPFGLIDATGQNTKDTPGFSTDNTIVTGAYSEVGPVVPEPTSLLLLGTGLLGLGSRLRKRNKKDASTV